MLTIIIYYYLEEPRRQGLHDTEVATVVAIATTANIERRRCPAMRPRRIRAQSQRAVAWNEERQPKPRRKFGSFCATDILAEAMGKHPHISSSLSDE